MRVQLGQVRGQACPCAKADPQYEQCEFFCIDGSSNEWCLPPAMFKDSISILPQEFDKPIDGFIFVDFHGESLVRMLEHKWKVPS